MTAAPPNVVHLADRATIRVSGEDWRSFLQGLLTQDVETLAPGEVATAPCSRRKGGCCSTCSSKVNPTACSSTATPIDARR